MPKNPTSDILRRWRALDTALGGPLGLNVREFAQRYRVSTRTVQRDLEEFEVLGQSLKHRRDEDGNPRWFYDGGEYLFVSNVPSRARELAECQLCQAYHRKGHSSGQA
jgi:hypothetical protein